VCHANASRRSPSASLRPTSFRHPPRRILRCSACIRDRPTSISHAPTHVPRGSAFIRSSRTSMLHPPAHIHRGRAFIYSPRTSILHPPTHTHRGRAPIYDRLETTDDSAAPIRGCSALIPRRRPTILSRSAHVAVQPDDVVPWKRSVNKLQSYIPRRSAQLKAARTDAISW